MQLIDPCCNGIILTVRSRVKVQYSNLSSIGLCVSSADVIFFRDIGFPLSSGIALACSANRRVTILDHHDLTNHRRHVDQVQYNVLGQSEDIPTVNSSTYTTGLDAESHSRSK